MTKKYKHRGYKVLPITIIIIIIIITAGGFVRYCLGNINRAQYEERVSSTNVLMEKIATNVTTVIGQEWAFAHYVRNELSQMQFESRQDILSYMARCEKNYEESEDDRLLLVTENGEIVASDGRESLWKNQELLTAQEAFYVAPSYFREDRQAGLYFITPLAETIGVREAEFTHIVLAKPISALAPFFDISNYGRDSVTFIIRKDGTQIYRQENDKRLSGVYNVLSALKDVPFHYGTSLEKVKNDIVSGTNDTVNLSLKDEKYYLCYYHLAINDWVVLLFIPEKQISNGSGMLISIVARNMIYIFATMFFIFILIVGCLFCREYRSQAKVRASLEQAALAERKANQSKTNFLSSMSHDIRTPMNAIVNFTEYALKRLDDRAFVTDSLYKIQISSRHLLMLINDVLDISKIESNKIALNQSEFNLERTIDEISDIMAPKIKESGLHYRLYLSPLKAKYLYGDELRLKQIYLNILSNAIKYNVPNGSIHVSISEEIDEAGNEAVLHFTCSDTGIGISEAFRSRMYESFARSSDSRVDRISGTGLGLAICKKLIDMMGGTITCQSEQNRGTTFRVRLRLPIADYSEKAQTDAGIDIEYPPEKWYELLHSMHVLVAEDSRMNREVLAMILGDVGIEADFCEDGRECVGKLMNSPDNCYDIVLMDIRMPNMDGREATRVIRQSNRSWLKRLPIVALSADAFAEDRQESLEAGMDEHIAKPVKDTELYRLLWKVKREKRGRMPL